MGFGHAALKETAGGLGLVDELLDRPGVTEVDQHPSPPIERRVCVSSAGAPIVITIKEVRSFR
jgi:hypothetical protein